MPNTQLDKHLRQTNLERLTNEENSQHATQESSWWGFMFYVIIPRVAKVRLEKIQHDFGSWEEEDAWSGG